MAVEGWKILQTMWIFWCLVLVGIGDSLLGPSLLDLQSLLQVDLEQLNYIVLSTGLGEFFGAILSGVLAKTSDVHIRVCISVLLGSVAVAVSTAVGNYYYVCAMFTIQGLLRGIVYCYAMEKCSVLWGENKGVPLQFVLLGPTAGGSLSPSIVKLFLCKPYDLDTSKFNNFSQYQIHNDSTFWLSKHGDLMNTVLNTTGDKINGVHNNIVESVNVEGSDNSTALTATSCLPHEVNLTLPYLILGLITLPSAFAFFVYWRKSKGAVPENHVTETVQEVTTVPRNRKQVWLFSVLFVIFYFPLLGGSVMYSTFLTEFGVKGPLHLDKSNMVLLTTLFWIALLTGRILCILLTPILGVEKLIILNIIPLVVCETILIFTVSHSETMLWVCTCAIGLFISSYVGAGYAWCAGYVTFDSRIISASGASLGLGAMVLPFLAGVVLEKLGPMAYLYFFYSLYLYVAFMFFLLLAVAKRINQHPVILDVTTDITADPLCHSKDSVILDVTTDITTEPLCHSKDSNQSKFEIDVM